MAKMSFLSVMFLLLGLELLMLALPWWQLIYLDQRFSNPFNVMIAPFMTLTSAPAFRQLLADTNAVVSGSSALAFFNIGSFVGADLDIYTKFESVYLVGSFFIGMGYHFVPHLRQHFPFPALACYGSPDDYPGDDSLVYLSSTIVDVFTFMNHAGKKVQVIASRLSFMHTILSFHSTLVMNFITATHAISLYPFQAFILHVNARAEANGLEK
ncbi:hypothetical protein BDZ89DRAFT_1044066 [Hymenopellis radicata]|nr:hypothetical protein BDZ89DRAFT_1044066 [Hymenopellis radicata]